MANFDIFYTQLAKHEGGYVNHGADRGGETYAGISRRYHPTWSGWNVIDSTKKPITTISSLVPLVKDFYYREFWDKIQGNQIKSQSVANLLADYAVNSGISRAIKDIQGILGVVQDGIIGSITVNAINSSDSLQLFEALKSKRIAYVNQIARNDSSQSVFLNGWLNRINSFFFSDTAKKTGVIVVGLALLGTLTWLAIKHKR